MSDVFTTVSSSYVPSPVAVDVIASQVAVLGVVGATTAYWWFALVPTARARLAVNKRTGALRTYLEELKADRTNTRALERWFYSEWLAKVDLETKYLLAEEVDVRANERETTRLDETGPGVRSNRERSVEEIVRDARKTPKFWSLDNPVLVGTALGVGAAALFSGGPPS